MRIRTVKPAFFSDPDSTGRWPPNLKILYEGLWCYSDDECRFQWELVLIQGAVDPFHTLGDLELLLGSLVEKERVVPYEVGGRHYGWLPKMQAHQVINRPTPSQLPPPPRDLTERFLSPQLRLLPGREGKGKERKGSSSDPGALTDRSLLPLVAWIREHYPDVKDPIAFVQAAREAYPGVDLLVQARRALAWEIANPQRKKRQHGRFLSNWWARQQDQGLRPPPTQEATSRRVVTGLDAEGKPVTEGET